MKKLLCLILAVVLLMGTLSITAFATEEDTSDDVTIDELRIELSDLYMRAYSVTKGVGEIKPYIEASFVRLEEAMESAEAINRDNATKEEYENAIAEFKYAFDNAVIDPNYAKETYVLSLEEHNDNEFYDEADWNDFIEKRDALRDSFNIGDVTEISNAYFALYDSFVNMTNNKYLNGDVNNDGVVDIEDATLIQKYVTDTVTFTGVQVDLAAYYCAEDQYKLYEMPDCGFIPEITVDNVTAMQKAIVDGKLSTKNLQYGTFKTDSMGVEFNSKICTELFDNREWVYEKVKELEAEGII